MLSPPILSGEPEPGLGDQGDPDKAAMNLRIELDKEESEWSPYLTEALHYLEKFWDRIFNGCRDFFSMTPQNIGLAPSNC